MLRLADEFHGDTEPRVKLAGALQQLAAVTVKPDQCHCSEKEIYFYFPNGVSQSVLFKSPVDRILAVVTTTRNWKTVNSLRQLCQDCL